MNKNISIAIAILLVLGIGVYAYMNSNSGEENNTDSIVCSQEYAPVCGVDGMTYSNACVATMQNEVQIAYEGECMLLDQQEEMMMPDYIMEDIMSENLNPVGLEEEILIDELPENIIPEYNLLEVELE